MISTAEYEIRFIFAKLKHHFATSAASSDRQISWKTHSSWFIHCKITADELKILVSLSILIWFWQLRADSKCSQENYTGSSMMCAYMYTCMGCVYSVPPRIAKWWAALLFGLLDGDLAHLWELCNCLMKTSGPGKHVKKTAVLWLKTNCSTTCVQIKKCIHCIRTEKKKRLLSLHRQLCKCTSTHTHWILNSALIPISVRPRADVTENPANACCSRAASLSQSKLLKCKHHNRYVISQVKPLGKNTSTYLKIFTQS